MDANETFLTYLNSMGDDDYFLVATLTLGKVQTPFHKPVLNQRILAFLLGEDNRRSIVASLDRTDLLYIALAHLAQSVSPREVHSLLGLESYPMTVTRLANLKDRLILLESGLRFSLNPVLRPAILPKIDFPELLRAPRKTVSDQDHVDRNVLFAVLNLLISGSVPAREANLHHFFKSDKLEKVFPQFGRERSIGVFNSLRDLFLKEGAVHIRDNRYLIDIDRATSLLGLDTLNLAIRAIGTDFGDTVVRLLDILRTYGMDLDMAKALLGIMANGKTGLDSADIVSRLIDFGLVVNEQGKLYLNQCAFAQPKRRSAVQVDSDMVISYYGIPEPNDRLYIFSDVQVCDKLISYRMTKSSFTRALEAGLSKDEIVAYLGNDIDGNQLSMWQSAFERITLYDGIALRCDPQIRTIVTTHPDLRAHILATPADNVIVMKRSTYPQWQSVLAYALDLPNLGIPIGDNEVGQKKPDDTVSPNHYELGTAEGQAPCSTADETPWESIRDDLLSHARQMGCLTDDVKALIDAKLIVSRSQIGKGFRYATQPSVTGFDYNAKLSALRAILKDNKSLLTLELPDETIVAKPLSLTKDQDQNGILKVSVLPDETERSIPVASIFRVTVMRWTLN